LHITTKIILGGSTGKNILPVQRQSQSQSQSQFYMRQNMCIDEEVFFFLICTLHKETDFDILVLHVVRRRFYNARSMCLQKYIIFIAWKQF
jgi:hypothetical protein